MKSRLMIFSLLAILATVAMARCDDHVIVDRDTSIPVRKGMTWAWRPSGPAPPAANRAYRR